MASSKQNKRDLKFLVEPSSCDKPKSNTPGPLRQASPSLSADPSMASTSAFIKTMQDYVDNLSHDDKEAFRSAPDIIGKLWELQRSQPHITDPLTTRVQKVVQCVKNFMMSIISVVQPRSEICSLVVDGANSVLTLGLGYIEFFESLVHMMERIGGHLSYLSEYATGTTVSQNLYRVQQAHVGAYCDLLDFYVKVRALFMDKEGITSYAQSSTSFLIVAWKPFEAQFPSIEARFVHHADTVRLTNAEHHFHHYREDKFDRGLNDERRRKILKWLSPDDFEEVHERHVKKRFPNTGQWLLDDPRFISWRDETQSSILWCHGALGSGKTVLASLVAEHLSALYGFSSNMGVTFIYCNYDDPRTPAAYIKLAIKQLCRRMAYLPHRIQEAYETHYRNHSQPSYKELQSMFLTIAQQFDKLFLVIDALDACTPDQRTELCEFFSGIIESIAISKPAGTTSHISESAGPTSTDSKIFKLFVTSRNDIGIDQVFLQEPPVSIEIEPAKVDLDIAVYANAQVERRLRDHRLTLKNMALKDKILTALTTKADGIFLWAELMLNAVCEQVCDNTIEKALTDVPKEMITIYERVFNTVDKKPEAQRELAKKVIMHLAYSESPISIDSLAYVVSIKQPTQTLKNWEFSTPTEAAILGACASLILVERKTRHVHFFHHSIRQFLTSCQPLGTFKTLNFEHKLAHREIAQRLITSLSVLYSRSTGDCSGMKKYSQLLNTLNEWPHHLLAGDLSSLPTNDPMVTLTLSFFKQSPPILTPYLACDKRRTYFSFPQFTLSTIFNLPGNLYYSSKVQPVDMKQLKEQLSINAINQGFIVIADNRFVMRYATNVLDSVPAAQRLHNYSYRIDNLQSHNLLNTISSDSGNLNIGQIPQSTIPDMFKYPPLYSVKSGEVANFLITNGVSTGTWKLDDKSIDPLVFFAEKGNTEVTRILYDKIPQSSYEARHRNALEGAIRYNRVEVIQLFLDKQFNINTWDGEFCNALQVAAYHDSVEAMRVLLDTGIDVNAQGGIHGSALHAATQNGSLGAINLLLDQGADVNAQGGKYSTALQALVHLGNTEALKLLLDRGADVNAQGGKYGTALQTAGHLGNFEAIQLLLDRGADVNAKGGEYGNALRAAIYNGGLEAIALILDKGADADAQIGEYGTALQTLVHLDNIEALKLLLDRGADVNIPDGKSGGALQAAAYLGKLEVVQLLLDKGADVNAQGGNFGNPLQAGACGGDLEMVQLLLNKGADIGAQGGHYGNALQAAAFHGKVDVVKLLLQKRADVNAPGGIYGSALQAASHRCHYTIVQLLLDKGAQVNIWGGKYGTALQATVAPVHDDTVDLKNPWVKPSNDIILSVVQLLLDRGAYNGLGSEYGDALTAAKQLWRSDATTLAQFTAILQNHKGT